MKFEYFMEKFNPAYKTKPFLIFLLLYILFVILILSNSCNLDLKQEKNMAIEILPVPTGGAPLTTDDYDSQNVEIQNSIFSVNRETIYLTEWGTLIEPEIEQGVVIHHAGNLYIVNGNLDLSRNSNCHWTVRIIVADKAVGFGDATESG